MAQFSSLLGLPTCMYMTQAQVKVDMGNNFIQAIPKIPCSLYKPSITVLVRSGNTHVPESDAAVMTFLPLKNGRSCKASLVMFLARLGDSPVSITQALSGTTTAS